MDGYDIVPVCSTRVQFAKMILSGEAMPTVEHGMISTCRDTTYSTSTQNPYLAFSSLLHCTTNDDDSDVLPPLQFVHTYVEKRKDLAMSMFLQQAQETSPCYALVE